MFNARRRAFESDANTTDTAKPLCDAERHELHADAERRHDNQVLTLLQLTPHNLRVTLRDDALDVLFNHDGTGDAKCDVSDG